MHKVTVKWQHPRYLHCVVCSFTDGNKKQNPSIHRFHFKIKFFDASRSRKKTDIETPFLPRCQAWYRTGQLHFYISTTKNWEVCQDIWSKQSYFIGDLSVVASIFLIWPLRVALDTLQSINHLNESLLSSALLENWGFQLTCKWVLVLFACTVKANGLSSEPKIRRTHSSATYWITRCLCCCS